MAIELPRYAPTIEGEICGDRAVGGQTYEEQFKEVFARELTTSKPLRKPRPARASDPGAKRIPFSNVWGTLMRSPFSKDRTWVSTDVGRLLFFAFNHGVGIFAPVLFFSWHQLGLHFLLYCASGMGITYSYHRQLAHRSFKSKKWLEYLACTCGMLAMQGGPIEWVSDHRYHHLHTETALDPHSSYEGFYWSHLGWMLDAEVYEARCSDRSNVQDLQKQAFYRLVQGQYLPFVLAHYGLFYALGGLPALCWRCFATTVLHHVTWFVNSAAHTWGKQDYATGDQSRNNWWVGWLAFGEGWHNNHHAFEYSARHGLRARQFDITWLFIRGFQKLGLVSNVKLPTEAAKRRLALSSTNDAA